MTEQSGKKKRGKKNQQVGSSVESELNKLQDKTENQQGSGCCNVSLWRHHWCFRHPRWAVPPNKLLLTIGDEDGVLRVFIWPLSRSCDTKGGDQSNMTKLVLLMSPACFDSCYSWWLHHVKSSCSSSEIQQTAASVVAWAANRLKWKNSWHFCGVMVFLSLKATGDTPPPWAIHQPKVSRQVLSLHLW